jgi:hypothetical protein
MANGKWRERLRRARDRVLRRQEEPAVVQPPVPDPTPSEPQMFSPTAPKNAPVIQLGPNQPVYYYPPAHLHDNLPNSGQPAAPFDVCLPVPTSGLSPRPVIGPQPSALPTPKPTWQQPSARNQAGTATPTTSTNPFRTGASTPSTGQRAHVTVPPPTQAPGPSSPSKRNAKSNRGGNFGSGGGDGRPNISYPSAPFGFAGPHIPPPSHPRRAATPPFK